MVEETSLIHYWDTIKNATKWLNFITHHVIIYSRQTNKAFVHVRNMKECIINETWVISVPLLKVHYTKTLKNFESS